MWSQSLDIECIAQAHVDNFKSIFGWKDCPWFVHFSSHELYHVSQIELIDALNANANISHILHSYSLYELRTQPIEIHISIFICVLNIMWWCRARLRFINFRQNSIELNVYKHECGKHIFKLSNDTILCAWFAHLLSYDDWKPAVRYSNISKSNGYTVHKIHALLLRA